MKYTANLIKALKIFRKTLREISGKYAGNFHIKFTNILKEKILRKCSGNFWEILNKLMVPCTFDLSNIFMKIDLGS